MKKFILSLLSAVALCAAPAAMAQIEITKVDKVQPNDQIFMDMAVSAAKTSVADGGLPCGSVVILNGAWRSTGMPSNGITAEQVAINKSRAKSLANASIYTVVQPTTAAAEAIRNSGADAVYFVIPADVAVAKGIYKQSDYQGDAPAVKMIQLPFDEATALVNGWKK